jgi:hypothetical protein
MSTANLTEIFIHILGVLIAKIFNMAKTEIFQIPSYTRTNTRDRLKIIHLSLNLCMQKNFDLFPAVYFQHQGTSHGRARLPACTAAKWG